MSYIPFPASHEGRSSWRSPLGLTGTLPSSLWTPTAPAVAVSQVRRRYLRRRTGRLPGRGRHPPPPADLRRPTGHQPVPSLRIGRRPVPSLRISRGPDPRPRTGHRPVRRPRTGDQPGRTWRPPGRGTRSARAAVRSRSSGRRRRSVRPAVRSGHWTAIRHVASRRGTHRQPVTVRSLPATRPGPPPRRSLSCRPVRSCRPARSARAVRSARPVRPARSLASSRRSGLLSAVTAALTAIATATVLMTADPGAADGGAVS